MIALAKAADSANVITGQGTLDVLRYGSILPARTIVQVQGAGITYDGEYFVYSITHTIKPGSYKQSFTLQRNRLIGGNALDPSSYGLGQQLPAFSSASGQAASAPALPSPGPALPVPAPGGPAVPATAGGSITSSLPALAGKLSPNPNGGTVPDSSHTKHTTMESIGYREQFTWGSEQDPDPPVAKRHWGKYRGTVIDNQDTPPSGRLLVSVPGIVITNWAMPCVPFTDSEMGTFVQPRIGANVWVEFERGDPDKPIWVGCWWGEGQIPVMAEEANAVPGVPAITIESATAASRSATCRSRRR